MPYTMEQFRKEYIEAYLNELELEEVLSKYNQEELLKWLRVEIIEPLSEKAEKMAKNIEGNFPRRHIECDKSKQFQQCDCYGCLRDHQTDNPFYKVDL